MHVVRLAMLFIILTLVVGCGPGRDHFDSAEWKASDQNGRRKVAIDLIDRKLALGKDRAEVIELLGEPDVSESDWIKYYIDSSRFRILDRQFMLVSFDKASGKAMYVTLADD